MKPRSSPSTAEDSTWEAFVRGIREPSLAAVSVLCLTVGLMPTIFIFLITPEFMVSATAKYLLESPTDHDIYTTAQALTLSQTPSSVPRVLVVCSSAVGHSISSEREATDAVSRKIGRQVEVHVLMTSQQALWDAMVILDATTKGKEDFVVLSIGPGKLSSPTEALGRRLRSPRLAIPSEAFDREIRISGLQPRIYTGNYFLDYKEVFIPRLLPLIIGLVFKREPVAHLYTPRRDRTPVSQSRWEWMAKRIKDRLGAYDKERKKNLMRLRRIVNLVVSRGAGLALLEHPINPRFIREELGAEFYKSYQNDIRGFAEEWGVPYWQTYEAAEFQEAEYYDWCHIRNRRAAVRFTQLLATEIANEVALQ